jgi:hypothetical protein
VPDIEYGGLILMAVGDLTCTLVGSYATIALAVAAVDADNLPAATDTIVILPEVHPNEIVYRVVKTVRASS